MSVTRRETLQDVCGGRTLPGATIATDRVVERKEEEGGGGCNSFNRKE